MCGSVLDDTKRKQADATVEGATLMCVLAVIAREVELKARDGLLDEAAALVMAAQILQERFERVEPLMVKPR